MKMFGTNGVFLLKEALAASQWFWVSERRESKEEMSSHLFFDKQKVL